MHAEDWPVDASGGQALGFTVNVPFLLARSSKTGSFAPHMRNFFGSLLGSLTALVIFFTGLCVFGMVFLIAIAAAGNKEHTSSIRDGSYLHFNLGSNITDGPEHMDFSALAGDSPETLQLRAAVTALHAAAEDKRISGVVLTGSFAGEGYGCSLAALRELRAALASVRKAGKPVVAYLNDADLRDYYVASVADDVAIDPYGMILVPGLAARPTFYAGAFEKFGIGVQYTRVGKYKSAIEPYTRKDFSPENREQLGGLLNDLWTGVITEIADSRKLKVSDVQAISDNEALVRGGLAVKLGLADRAIYRDQLIDELKKKTGVTEAKESFRQVSMEDYINANSSDLAPALSGARVAVIYAEGTIVDGQGGPGEIGGSAFSREIRKLRNDDDVKAIVLRVNSPGGSASASEMIQRELRLAKESKPVIVSMGGYAASGGYWISAYGTRIYAEPTTITGSIGVFGLFMDVEKLAGSVGLSFDTVKTSRHADVFSMTRPKTDEELRIIQKSVDWIYEEFVSKVAEGRGIERTTVEEIAQGRVWSGEAALKLKLVDQIGGLGDAIAEAGRQAGLGENPPVIEYPRKKELAEVIAELFEKLDSVRAQARTPGLSDKISERVRREYEALNTFNDPQGIYARLPVDLVLE